MPNVHDDFCSDYADISKRHKEIARRLVDPRANDDVWKNFFGEVRGIVYKRFRSILKNDAGLEVDQFLNGHLMSYLAADKCVVLRRFLNLNGPTHHFGSPFFVNHILAAVDKAVAENRTKFDFVNPTSQNDEGDEVNVVEQVANGEALVGAESEGEGDPITVAIEECPAVFSAILARFWKASPHECYAAMMDWYLKFDHRKIVALFGVKDVGVIAGNIRNLKRKLARLSGVMPKTHEEDDKEFLPSLFRADGERCADPVAELGRARCRLTFEGIRRGRSDRFRLEMNFPFEAKDGTLIRCVLTDGTGTGLQPEGRLFLCGAYREAREDGAFELPIEEFRAFHNSSELYFEWTDGARSDGFPFIPSTVEEYALTRQLIEKWAKREVGEANALAQTATFLNDFGLPLTLLLLSEDSLAHLPLSKFGFPAIDRRSIRRGANESWILFRGMSEVADRSPLDPNGFLLPVEWSYSSLGGTEHSQMLPFNLTALAEKVRLAYRAEGYRLMASSRFFDERVYLGDVSASRNDATAVSSATVALAVGLEYALGHNAFPQWPFNSISWDFNANSAQAVSGICNKAAVARAWGASRFFVAASDEQERVPPEMGEGISFVSVSGANLTEVAKTVAYDYLSKLRPAEMPVFRVPQNDEYLERRRKIVTAIRTLANPNPKVQERKFVTLFGKPGMGKSVLTGLLADEMERRKWVVLPFVCRAGRSGQGLEFAKTAAYSLAMHFGELHAMVDAIPTVPTYAAGEDLASFYRKTFYAPLCALAEKYRAQKFVVVIDGLDEDRDGEILSLLSRPEFRFPVGVGVVVSTRRLPQDEGRLEALSTAVVDLNGKDAKVNDECYTDLRAYIELWLLRDERVQQALLNANATSEETKRVICEKDPSFIYAYHVLNGVAEGRYSFDRLKEQLPVDLCAAFYDAFIARFPTADDYAKVKPLLALLVRNGSVRIAEVEERVARGDVPVGECIRSLRGYAAVEGKNVVMTSEPLREWLLDGLNNPTFAVKV